MPEFNQTEVIKSLVLCTNLMVQSLMFYGNTIQRSADNSRMVVLGNILECDSGRRARDALNYLCTVIKQYPQEMAALGICDPSDIAVLAECYREVDLELKNKDPIDDLLKEKIKRKYDKKQHKKRQNGTEAEFDMLVMKLLKM